METVKVGPVSVSQLNNYLKQRLDKDEALRLVCVEGELSNFTDHASGHMYFSLKDRESAIKAVMFRGHRQGLTFRPASGMKVIVVGDVSFTPRQALCSYTFSICFPRGRAAFRRILRRSRQSSAPRGCLMLRIKSQFPVTRRKLLSSLLPLGRQYGI